MLGGVCFCLSLTETEREFLIVAEACVNPFSTSPVRSAPHEGESKSIEGIQMECVSLCCSNARLIACSERPESIQHTVANDMLFLLCNTLVAQHAVLLRAFGVLLC